MLIGTANNGPSLLLQNKSLALLPLSPAMWSAFCAWHFIHSNSCPSHLHPHFVGRVGNALEKWYYLASLFLKMLTYSCTIICADPTIPQNAHLEVTKLYTMCTAWYKPTEPTAQVEYCQSYWIPDGGWQQVIFAISNETCIFSNLKSGRPLTHVLAHTVLGDMDEHAFVSSKNREAEATKPKSSRGESTYSFHQMLSYYLKSTGLYKAANNGYHLLLLK